MDDFANMLIAKHESTCFQFIEMTKTYKQVPEKSQVFDLKPIDFLQAQYFYSIDPKTTLEQL